MVTLAFKRRQLGGGPKAKWLKGLSSIMLVKGGNTIYRKIERFPSTRLVEEQCLNLFNKRVRLLNNDFKRGE